MEVRLGDISAPKNFPCVKNNFWHIFGTQRNLKACCSESIYTEENISNIWCIGKQLCWRTIRTTKKSSRRTRAVKLLTMSCHIKIRESFLVNRNRIWTSVQVVNGRLTLIFLQSFCRFVTLWWCVFQNGLCCLQNYRIFTEHNSLMIFSLQTHALFLADSQLYQ